MKRSNYLIVLFIVFFEWLDFSLYLYLAKSVFSLEFFPQNAHSLTLTFGLFAGAYLARPIGGWIFGYAADKHGRKMPMLFSALLMGVSTLGICLLPGFKTLGLLSTVLLLILRIGQGLALGGEIHTSAVFLIEHQKQRRLFVGSLVSIFGALGMFAGGAFAAIITSSNINFLWRVVFAIIGIASLAICKLRGKLHESPEYLKLSRDVKTFHWSQFYKAIGNIAATAAFVSITVYLCNVFWINFAIQKKIWAASTCVWLGASAQLASALIALPIAFYGSEYPPRLLLQFSMLIMAIVAPCLFYYTQMQMQSAVLVTLCGYAVGNALLCSGLAYFLYQQLPTQYRCQGISITWGITATLGALSLPITEQYVSQYGAYWLPGAIVSLFACVGLISILNFLPITFNYKEHA